MPSRLKNVCAELNTLSQCFSKGIAADERPLAALAALSMLDRSMVIFAHKSNRRNGDVVIRRDVANSIFGHCTPS
jgi:hypothetical protein